MTKDDILNIASSLGLYAGSEEEEDRIVQFAIEVCAHSLKEFSDYLLTGDHNCHISWQDAAEEAELYAISLRPLTIELNPIKSYIQ